MSRTIKNIIQLYVEECNNFTFRNTFSTMQNYTKRTKYPKIRIFGEKKGKSHPLKTRKQSQHYIFIFRALNLPDC